MSGKPGPQMNLAASLSDQVQRMRKQKANAVHSLLNKILCGLILSSAWFLLSAETKSLKGEQLVFVGRAEKYASLVGPDVPELCTFTVCINVNRAEAKGSPWAAFSYDINTSSLLPEDIELALLAEDQKLKMSLLGAMVHLGDDLPLYDWQQLCFAWDGPKDQLQFFHNGTHMKNVVLPGKTSHKCLRPQGTLVVGQLHKNQNGRITLFSSMSFMGNLHYFQMWNHTRNQQQLAQCSPGNVISWEDSDWTFNDSIASSDHHLRCAGDKEAPSASPPPTIKTPDPTVPDLSGISTVPSRDSRWTTSTLKPDGTTSEANSAIPQNITFYNIEMRFSVVCNSSEPFDSYNATDLSVNWFKKILQAPEFVVTNHNVRTVIKLNNRKGRLWTRVRKQNREQRSQSFSSKSIIKATSNLTKEELEEKLQRVLQGPYVEKSAKMIVDQKDVNVTALAPGTCPEISTQSESKGNYTWPETTPVDAAYRNCEKNTAQNASMKCLINIRNGQAGWRRPNLKACCLLQVLPNDIMELKYVTVTVENAEEVADHILNLTISAELNQDDIKILVDKLLEIANCEEISETLALNTLKIIDTLMTKNAKNLQPEVNSILKIVELIGFKMDYSKEIKSIVFPGLALAVLRPDPMNFQGVLFGVTSYQSYVDPELVIRPALAVEFETAVAVVFLPPSLKNYSAIWSLEPEDYTAIQFTFFGETSLFEGGSLKNQNLNTYVVGASIGNVSVQNLEDPVQIILQHITPKVKDSATTHCVFWDYNNNYGRGGWNTAGCKIDHSDTNYTICSCYHLTHFGVLLDVSRDGADNPVLTLISYVGCGISSIFLGLTLVVYLSIDKIRKDYPSQILTNLCFALLLLNLVYLVNTWLTSYHNHGLCIAVAASLHYCLLAAFTWMGLEAIHMYYALVKVFNTYVPNYMLKVSIAGWGIPAVTVATVVMIKTDFYGSGTSSKSNTPFTLFCWIEDNVVFYISVVTYFCLVFLMNMAMFITVLLQIQAMKVKNRGRTDSWRHGILRDLKRVASLSVLLGLTWGFAFFALGPVKEFFMYLFAICNTLQGLFIFVFYCLMKENVRKQCQVYFCLGRFRLSYSDWNCSGTTLGYHHPRNCEQKLSTQSLNSLKSCGTSSTSNGSSCLQRASLETNVETAHVRYCTDYASLTDEDLRRH